MPIGQNNFLEGHATFFNARSAIRYLFDCLNPKEIWLPSFLCKTIIQGNHKFNFYDCDLFEDISYFFNIANKENNLFYYIDYFGFSKKINFENKKCIVVQDCCQSIFLKKNNLSDYAVYSYPKILSVFDGGSIFGLNHEIKYNHVDASYNEHFNNNFKSLILRRQNQKSWRNFYLKSKNKLVGNYDMSIESKQLITNSNLREIRMRQIENYEFICNFVKPLFKLSKSDTPIGFPIFSKKRDYILNTLIENKIYCPIHWLIESDSKKARETEEKILTIPCSWCYSLEDMKRIVDVLIKNNLIELINN